MLTKLEKIQSNVDYFIGFCGHNKNLTKTQIEKLQEIHEIIQDFSTVQEILKNIYLEYLNEYLTLEAMAENENISKENLKTLIEMVKNS